ncbi:hypothetical protein GCM10028827_16380 [Mucilaginibacter myungsuensis]
MNYSRLMSERIDCFHAALAALPLPQDVPAEILVLSVGREQGNFCYRHVYAEADTLYFIFRRTGVTDGLKAVWECTDRELEMLAKERAELTHES